MIRAIAIGILGTMVCLCPLISVHAGLTLSDTPFDLTWNRIADPTGSSLVDDSHSLGRHRKRGAHNVQHYTEGDRRLGQLGAKRRAGSDGRSDLSLLHWRRAPDRRAHALRQPRGQSEHHGPGKRPQCRQLPFLLSQRRRFGDLPRLRRRRTLQLCRRS